MFEFFGLQEESPRNIAHWQGCVYDSTLFFLFQNKLCISAANCIFRVEMTWKFNTATQL